MISTVILDTSVLIKWFRQGEELAPQALSLREDYLNGKISISVFDATFLVLAEALKGRFITADHQLTRNISALDYITFLGQIAIS